MQAGRNFDVDASASDRTHFSVTMTIYSHIRH